MLTPGGQKTKLQKIQIWSNANGSEFAIRLSTDIINSFRAATRHREKYDRIVDETEYMHDMKYEWDYTLKYWVDTHHVGTVNTKTGVLENSHSNSTSNDGFILARNSISNNVLPIDEKFSDSALLGFALSSVSKKESDMYKKKRSAGSKPKLKCHYCGLMFSDELDRAGHEKEWHRDRITRK